MCAEVDRVPRAVGDATASLGEVDRGAEPGGRRHRQVCAPALDISARHEGAREFGPVARHRNGASAEGEGAIAGALIVGGLNAVPLVALDGPVRKG
jgi:hypothetical protein